MQRIPTAAAAQILTVAAAMKDASKVNKESTTDIIIKPVKKGAVGFELALEQVELSLLQKTIFEERFIRVVRNFEHRCWVLAFYFHLARVLITVGSLIVPALLSIQYVNTDSATIITDPGSFAYQIYWTTWVLSLLVTTSNGIVSIFKIDKKYYFLHTTLEQLRSEGWQYLELSGRYSGFLTPHLKPTHDNQFVHFCHAVEKIKLKQVQEEYFKLSDSANSGNKQATGIQENGLPPGAVEGAHDGKTVGTFVPPTPLNNLVEQAQALPPELLKQIYAMVTAPNAKSPDTIEGLVSDEVKQKTSEGCAATAPALPMSGELQGTAPAEKRDV